MFLINQANDHVEDLLLIFLLSRPERDDTYKQKVHFPSQVARVRKKCFYWLAGPRDQPNAR